MCHPPAFHINVDRTTIADNNGRPQDLIEDGGKVMPELV